MVVLVNPSQASQARSVLADELALVDRPLGGVVVLIRGSLTHLTLRETDPRHVQ